MSSLALQEPPALVHRRTRALSLVWLVKEWRAQRLPLLGYLGLALGCVSLSFAWRDEAFLEQPVNQALVLGVFIAVAALGAVVIAAPLAARGEWNAKDDQFLRRLPGGLGAAFAGKIGFLSIAQIALPTLGWLGGELFLLAHGQAWLPIAEVSPIAMATASGVGSVAGLVLVSAILLVLATPAVFAVSWWMPQGRMAVGATALLVLGLMLPVRSLLDAAPGLDHQLGVGSWRWLWYFVPLSMAVGWVTLVRGRRGGDYRRSALLGVATLVVGLLPVAAWLASWTSAYHRPDLQQLERIRVEGVSPDGRYAIGSGAGRMGWLSVPMRIDLDTGHAQQVAGVGGFWTRQVVRARNDLDRRRTWLLLGDDARLLDAVSGSIEPADCSLARAGSPRDLELTLLETMPLAQRQRFDAERRLVTPLRAPNQRRAWIEVDNRATRKKSLVIETENEPIRLPWTALDDEPQPAGHGFVLRRGKGNELFDLTRRAFVTPDRGGRSYDAWCVSGLWLLRVVDSGAGTWHWQTFDPDSGSQTACPELANCEAVALFDDHEVVFRTRRRDMTDAPTARVFTYHVSDGRVTPITLPADLGNGQVWSHGPSPYGIRDSRGRLWLKHDSYQRAGNGPLTTNSFARVLRYLVVDQDRKAMPILDGNVEVFAFGEPDAPETVLAVEDHRRIVRIDYEKGTKTVLFPRGQ